MKLLLMFMLLVLGVVAVVAPHGTRYNDTDTTIVDIVKRNPCDGIDYEPVINREYYEADCPAKKHVCCYFLCDSGFLVFLTSPVSTTRDMLNNGNCEDWWIFDPEGCSSYCQVRTYYHYIRESPFPRGECHYPTSCEITESHTTTTGWNTGYTAKMGKAFKIGISGGYSKSQGEAHGRSWKFEPQPGECGYFTFVGIMKTTCGTYTEGWSTFVNHRWTCNFPRTTINQCADQLWFRDGSPDPEGVVLFVRTDCVTREPLAPELQDPVYNQPEVALPRALLAEIQQSWVINTCTAEPRDGGYAWDIRGRGFADIATGPNGEKLREQLGRCDDSGEVADGAFTFRWTPADGTYDWWASGHVRGGDAKSCIGSAIMSVGGQTRDQCT